MIPFPYYGGKYYHIDFIAKFFPPHQSISHFIDVYGGSGTVILNVGPYEKETYNDLNADLARFFRVLKNDLKKLINSLELTLYSREEYRQAINQEIDISDVEFARRFYILAIQSFNGRIVNPAWRFSKQDHNHRMARPISDWLGSVNKLPIISKRFERINIESMLALDIIDKYNSSDSFFYIDPPYVSDSRAGVGQYGQYEMDDNDHRELAYILNNIEGKSVVSGYKNHLYDELFKGWNRVDAPVKFAPTSRKDRQESIWLNY